MSNLPNRLWTAISQLPYSMPRSAVARFAELTLAGDFVAAGQLMQPHLRIKVDALNAAALRSSATFIHLTEADAAKRGVVEYIEGYFPRAAVKLLPYAEHRIVRPEGAELAQEVADVLESFSEAQEAA